MEAFMGAGVFELPVYPLPLVLFPGHIVTMNVRCPEQRAMFSEAIGQTGRLGVLLCSDPGRQSGAARAAAIGTVASVADLNELRAGQTFFEVIGESKFRVRRMFQQQPYLLVEAEELPEHAAEIPCGLVNAVRQALFDYFDAKSGLTGGWLHEWARTADGATLSYIVGRYMDATLAVRQGLLEITGHTSRLEKELEILSSETLLLRQSRRCLSMLPGTPNLN
jgi:Lon protease-like protein